MRLMNCIFLFIFLLPLFNFTHQAKCVEQVLALDTLVNAVIKNNPDLAAAQARVQAAAHAIPRAKTLDDPQFTFRTINNPIGTGFVLPKQRRYKLTQNIPFPGKLTLRGEIEEHKQTFLQFEEITTAQDLALATKEVYFKLLFNHLAQQVNKENRSVTSRLIESALAKYKTGKGSQSHVLKAHTELQLLDDELLALENEETTLRALINALLNKSQDHYLGTPEIRFIPPATILYESALSIALQKRPELRGIQALIDQQYTAAQLAHQNYFPDFTLTFMFQNLPNTGQNAWGIDVGFNIPLWINQKQKQEKEEAEALALSHERSYTNLTSNIRGNIKKLISTLTMLDERIMLYQTSFVPTLTKTYVSLESHYRAGREDFIAVLDTLRQLHTAELELQLARITREITLAQLEKETAVPINSLICSPVPKLKKNDWFTLFKQVEKQ